MIKSIGIIFTILTLATLNANTTYFEFQNEDKGIFTESSEHLYGTDKSDNNFTMGIYFSHIPDASEDSKIRYQYTFTADTYANEYETFDRPYAGYISIGEQLYYPISIVKNINSVSHFEINLGVMGPHSGQQQMQNFFHKVIHAYTNSGYDGQVKNRYGGLLRYDQNFSFKYSLINNFLSIEFAPHITITKGSWLTYGAVGGNIVIGKKLNNITPPKFNYFSGSDVPSSHIKEWNWNLFAGLEKRRMYANYTLQGERYGKDTGAITMNKHIIEKQVGIKLETSTVFLDIILVERGIEFKEQKNKQQFARIGLGYHF